MTENPLLIVGYFVLAAFAFKLWLDDYRASRTNPNPNALPGATAAPRRLIVIGIVVALGILALEVVGEYALGIVDDQSDITALMLLALLAAAFVEELIFRGFLVIRHKGKAALIGSIIGFSLIFALLHPLFWGVAEQPEGTLWWQFQLTWDFSVKAWWSTGILFANSIWFYTLRFVPANTERSLWPCILAHFASNLGVFVVKLAQGHVVGWY